MFHKTEAIHHPKGQRSKISAHFSLNSTRDHKLTLLPLPSAPLLYEVRLLWIAVVL